MEPECSDYLCWFGGIMGGVSAWIACGVAEVAYTLGRSRGQEDAMDQAVVPQITSRRCPTCGKRMIHRQAQYVLASNPAQYPWVWWCACGQVEHGGVVRGKTEEDYSREEWERANSG